MNEFPKISIVTINFNQAKYLEDTILSVINQKYPNLEYIIIDGGSTDGSVDIIKKYASQLTYWVSEPDGGMYHAVQKGFSKSTGDIMAWINSDDFYLPGSFFEVAELFQSRPEVNWVRSLPMEAEEDGSLFRRIHTPWARWSKYRYLTNDFQFIQQESCFWRRKVWEDAGNRMDVDLKYAGDMELWSRFFRREQLYTAETHWAAFRHRGEDQISKQHLNEYLKECKQVIRRERKTIGMVYLCFLLFIKYNFGLCFFLNIPLFQKIYEWAFHIPPLIRMHKKLEPFSKDRRHLIIPPLFIGPWLLQKNPMRIR